MCFDIAYHTIDLVEVGQLCVCKEGIVQVLINRLYTAAKKKKKSRPFLGFKRVARKLCL